MAKIRAVHFFERLAAFIFYEKTPTDNCSTNVQLYGFSSGT